MTRSVNPGPRWWWWARAAVAQAGLVAMLFGMAQSTGFAMSWPYAWRIAVLAPHTHPHDMQVWHMVEPERWAESGPRFLETCGGFFAMCPWLYLTDWLWFIPLGALGAALLVALFPSHRMARHLAMIGVATGGALALLGLYMLLFVWGTTYPAALAQREIGWIFSLLTLAIGAASLIALVVPARLALRAMVGAIGNEHAKALFAGWWSPSVPRR